MADEADMSSDKQIELENRNLAYVRAKAQEPVPTSAVCVWCGDKTKGGARWCSAECRDDWHKYSKEC